MRFWYHLCLANCGPRLRFCEDATACGALGGVHDGRARGRRAELRALQRVEREDPREEAREVVHLRHQPCLAECTLIAARGGGGSTSKKRVK